MTLLCLNFLTLVFEMSLLNVQNTQPQKVAGANCARKGELT